MTNDDVLTFLRRAERQFVEVLVEHVRLLKSGNPAEARTEVGPLISELSARGEGWELQSRIDTEAGRAVYQSMARFRPIEAVDTALEEEAEPEEEAEAEETGPEAGAEAEQAPEDPFDRATDAADPERG